MLSGFRHIAVAGIVILSCTAQAWAETKPLETFSGAQLVPDDKNDGDSFCVKAGDRKFVVRLYFVDCPETSGNTDEMARRLFEQTCYFGLLKDKDDKEQRKEATSTLIEFGKAAKVFTEGILKDSFTVYTAFTDAHNDRVYAFVVTAKGEDLADLLVTAGLARTYGTKRETPSGVSAKDTVERLKDCECSAMLKHSGVWEKSNPDQIVKLRAELRREKEELDEIKEGAKAAEKPIVPIDLNKATMQELDEVPGIGPKTAEKIIARRALKPFEKVDDLLDIDGIGPAKLKDFSRYFKVSR